MASAWYWVASSSAPDVLVLAMGGDCGSAPRFAPCHHFIEVVQHVGHAHGSSKLADPLTNGENVCLGMRSKQAFDVLQVLWPASNGLHDEQIFNTRQTHAQAANIVNLAVRDRRLFERQTPKCNVDVDSGFRVFHQ